MGSDAGWLLRQPSMVSALPQVDGASPRAGTAATTISIPRGYEHASTPRLPASSPLLRPRIMYHDDTPLAESARQEDEARHELASRQRSLSRTRTHGAKLLMRAERRSTRLQMRDRYATDSGQTLARRIEHVTPASEEAATNLAVELNLAMTAMYPENLKPYFSLFRVVDDDDTGLMSFDEFSHMARRLLKLDVPQSKLEALWKFVDTDSSGYISLGEFVRLMRRGWDGCIAKLERIDRLRAERGQAGGITSRPKWQNMPFRKPTGTAYWQVDAMSAEQKRVHFLDCAHKNTLERTDEMQSRAVVLERERTIRSREVDLSSLRRKHPQLKDDPLIETMTQSMAASINPSIAVKNLADSFPASSSRSAVTPV